MPQSTAWARSLAERRRSCFVTRPPFSYLRTLAMDRHRPRLKEFVLDLMPEKAVETKKMIILVISKFRLNIMKIRMSISKPPKKWKTN